MYNLKTITAIAAAIFLTACGQQTFKHNKMNAKDSTDHSMHQVHHNHGAANEHMNKTSFEELVKDFEDPERIKTQKPDEAIALLGDIKGKTIMDIGAGTGYFAFRMQKKGAKVIAADVDERFQNFLSKKRDSLGISPSDLETRLILMIIAT
jgi:2-polyprenyl-3-methyl-5-hydroxy-6-metoxy-1,4-benzoquinol methylase